VNCQKGDPLLTIHRIGHVSCFLRYRFSFPHVLTLFGNVMTSDDRNGYSSVTRPKPAKAGQVSGSG
jgi:hypothetical protein